MLVSLGVQTSFVVWRDLLGVLSRLGRADEAYAVLREMQPKYGVKPDQSCYVRVVRAYCQSPAPTMTSASEGEKTGGAEMEAASGSPQRHDFTSLLANYSSYDDLPSLGLSMDDQRDARLSRSSSGLSMYQLGSGSAFNWRAGLDVVRDMRLQGVAPTANVWKYVYLSCAASTQVALGESVVGNMINLLSEMYQSDRILPQSLDWGHLVSLLNFDETSLEEVFEDYGGDGDIYANRGLHPFIGRSNRPIDREEALLIKLLLTFTPNALAQFLEQAVQVLCRQGQQGPDKAFHLLCKLKPHREAHLPAWNVLLTVYSSVGQTEKCHTVLKSFEHLTSTHAPISLWLRLVDSFAFRENAFEKSFAVADGLILKHDSKFGNYNSIDPDRQYLVPFFNRLLEIAVMANNPSRFAHYFQQISDMSLSPDLDTYRILAAQYTRSQRISLFDDCITEMIKLIVSGGGGDLETAELPHQRNTNYVDKIGTIVTDGIPNNSTSRNIAVAAAGLPKIEDILVKERNRRTRLVEIQFTPLLVVLVENEYWGTAERLIQRLREELSVSCEILCGRYMVNLASRGKIEDAVAYAERCILGMSIEFLRDLSVWHALLQHAREYKQPQEAQFTMEKMLFTLNIQPDVLCWNILIHTYGDAGRLSDVENTIKVSSIDLFLLT